MNYTIGLLLTLIIVSKCSSLRELDFAQSLYFLFAYEDSRIPDPLFTAFVNRRVDQLNVICANETLSNATKVFCLSTNNSLSLLLDWLSSDNVYSQKNNTFKYLGTRDLHKFYEQTVKILNKVYKFNSIPVNVAVDYFNTSSLESVNIYHFPLLLTAYINDIKLIREYEETIGKSKRVNVKIVEMLNSLSIEAKNLTNDVDWEDNKEREITRIAMDQCLQRFKVLMKIFRKNFLQYS
ncbi:uncharacterized protein LOC107366680 [Tetranychus urticae]|uniref:uncharacterized protein LOC107366680 n=1 Tax=Tetranychus urticae TaxID=32264 RepID=UPI00077B8B15|nr:uncharacterized protein LOC107366680 [Tetranychus urticae]